MIENNETVKMANKIIIDGYNLILAVREDFPGNLDLEGQREHLLRVLNSSQQLKKFRLIVIFDGRSEVKNLAPSSGRIRIIFSKGRKKADQIIQELVRKDPTPGQIEVVSSDREIQFTAKDHGAKVRESRDFWQQIRLKQNSKSGTGRNKTETDRSLSDREVREWLEIFKNKKSKND
jgi:predicted RNA-binding protein with PIN domain